MNRITREEFTQLVKASRIRQRLRRELRFVPETISDWEKRDFLAVMDKSRTEGVLVAPGISDSVVSFRLGKRIPNSSGRIEAIICDICATWRRGTESATITFEKSTGGVSFLICGDLECNLHVRGDTPTAVLSRVQLRETIASEKRVERLQARLRDILNEI